MGCSGLVEMLVFVVRGTLGGEGREKGEGSGDWKYMILRGVAP